MLLLLYLVAVFKKNSFSNIPLIMKETTTGDWWNQLNDDEFQDVFRMNKKTVVDLQAEIDHSENLFIDRVDKLLLACIWVLGNTRSFKEAETFFCIENIESKMQEYFTKILNLGSTYIVWPLENELAEVQKGFMTHYKFPKLVGVIGSLHIEINPESISGKAEYFNNIMHKHTIVLQVVCDNNLLVRDICVGSPGGKSIKQILEGSPLHSLITDPDGAIVKNDYLLLGGTEHPKLKNLLTPYEFSKAQKINERHLEFNILQNSVMCVVEKTFKCLETRFPRLTSVDRLNPSIASLLVSCICILHNFTRVRNDRCELYL
uniref:DDE Tnp4 domain-containing protein n=1 Tax=Photinus pyralis TaxID=7054 RepID=A0A1Y1MMY7_PHOPY